MWNGETLLQIVNGTLDVDDERELLLERGSLVLGPSEAGDDVRHLTFRNTLAGERVRITLHREQLAGAEFTGLQHHL